MIYTFGERKFIMANLPVIVKDKIFKKKIKENFYVISYTDAFFEKKLFDMTPINAAKWILSNKKLIKGYDFSKGYELTKEEKLAILWDIKDKWRAKVSVFNQIEAQGEFPGGWWETESKTEWLREIIKSS